MSGSCVGRPGRSYGDPRDPSRAPRGCHHRERPDPMTGGRTSGSGNKQAARVASDTQIRDLTRAAQREYDRNGRTGKFEKILAKIETYKKRQSG